VARLGGATRAVIADFIDGLCAPPEPASAEATERAAVEQVLSAACGECHGASSPVSDAARDGFHGVDDVDSMIASGHVIPCAVESSILLRRLRDGSMPPPGSGRPALEAEDIERVAAVVDTPCRR
jgi:mono/diheme cytochrome c family protein